MAQAQLPWDGITISGMGHSPSSINQDSPGQYDLEKSSTDVAFSQMALYHVEWTIKTGQDVRAPVR